METTMAIWCLRLGRGANITALEIHIVNQHGMYIYFNQPHLLNKYQINMGFAHFRKIWENTYVFVTYQIDIVK